MLCDGLHPCPSTKAGDGRSDCTTSAYWDRCHGSNDRRLGLPFGFKKIGDSRGENLTGLKDVIATASVLGPAFLRGGVQKAWPFAKRSWRLWKFHREGES